MFGRIFGTSPSVAYRWIRQKAAKLPQPVVDKQIKAMELDEMWHFIGSKNGSSRRWVVVQGERCCGALAILMLELVNDFIKKFEHLIECLLYIDNWEAFVKVFPADRHRVRKKYAICIEKNNRNKRYHRACMTRCRLTKVVSKKAKMVDVSL